MKLKIWSLYLCALLAFGAMVFGAGCQSVSPASQSAGSASVAPEPSGFPIVITDDAQRQVRVEREPQRIVSLSAATTEMVYALGLQDKLVGVDDYSDYPAEAKSKEKIGGYSTPNLEKIVVLNPDLILAANIHIPTILPELEKQHLTVVVFDPKTIDGVLDNLGLIGKISGRPAKADELNKTLRARIDKVAAKANAMSQKPRIFMELSPDLYTVGVGTFINDMITKAGGENIASDAQGEWPKLGPESIIVKDPEVIIFCDHGTDQGGVAVDNVKQRPGWSTVSAVKTGRIIAVEDVNILNRPSQRVVDGLEFLANAFQPDASP